MKFKSIDELVKYLNESSLSISDLDFETGTPISDNTSKITGVSMPIRFMLAGGEVYTEALIGEENILFVEDFHVTPNLCGTGKIYAFGREMLMNMCEMDGVTKVTLDVESNGTVRATEFILKYISGKEDSTPIAQIKPLTISGTQ